MAPKTREGYDILDKQSMGFTILEMPPSNFYNDRHQIVRVKYKGKFFDFRAFPTNFNPNPSDHLVLALVEEGALEGDGVHASREQMPPGLIDKQGNLASIPPGFCFFVAKRQKINTTNPQNGGASFSVSQTNMFDPEKVVVAVSPYLKGRDYTTKDEANGDVNDESIGFFVNRDGTVLIKSMGASITMGKEGIHLGGRLFQESSAVETGPLSDNSIGDMIGSTIPTAGAAWPKLPNFGYIANIVNSSRKFVEIVDKGRQAAGIITNLGNIV